MKVVENLFSGLLGLIGVGTLVGMIGGAVSVALPEAAMKQTVLFFHPSDKERVAIFRREWDRYVGLGLPTRIEELEPRIPDAENRAIDILAAAKSLKKANSSSRTPKTLEERVAALTLAEPHLAVIRARYTDPNTQWWAKTDWDTAQGAGFEEVAALKAAADAFVISAQVMAEKDQPPDQVIRELTCAFLMSEDARSNGPIISVLVGYAVYSRAIGGVREIATRWQDRPDKLALLEQTLLAHPPTVDVERVMTFETYFLIAGMRNPEVAQRTLSLEEQLELPESPIDAKKFGVVGPPQDKVMQATLGLYLTRFNDFIETVRRDGNTRAAWETFEKEVPMNEKTAAPSEKLAAGLLSWGMSRYDSVLLVEARSATTLAFLKVASHRAKTGSLPKDLAESGFNGSDPYAPGQPLKFVRDSQGVKIYSVGRNGVDDGGPRTSVSDQSDDQGVKF